MLFVAFFKLVLIWFSNCNSRKRLEIRRRVHFKWIWLYIVSSNERGIRVHP